MKFSQKEIGVLREDNALAARLIIVILFSGDLYAKL